VAALAAFALACVGAAGAGVGVGVGDAGAATSGAPDSLAQIVMATPAAGYAVTSQGVHEAPTFAPDPANAADTLLTPGGHATPGSDIEPYERTWRDAAGTNRVDDLLARFATPTAAAAFLVAVRDSLDTGEIVSSGPLASVPGGQTTTYFASAPEAGIGQAISWRNGSYVDVLSFFSSGTGNATPITSAAAARMAVAQYAALGTTPARRVAVTPPAKPGTSASGVVWAVVAVVVLASTLAVPLVLRRRTRSGGGLDPRSGEN
jgi:hypothetical protein